MNVPFTFCNKQPKHQCGDGDDGRLGLGDGQPRRRLTRVPQALFAGSRVVMVSCGFSHTMAVTAAGHAWTCGHNNKGQLGVGDTADRLGFTHVDAGQLGGARISKFNPLTNFFFQQTPPRSRCSGRVESLRGSIQRRRVPYRSLPGHW